MDELEVDELYKLKGGQTYIWIKDDISFFEITRIPGGWIYSPFLTTYPDPIPQVSFFVPYSDEFKP